MVGEVEKVWKNDEWVKNEDDWFQSESSSMESLNNKSLGMLIETNSEDTKEVSRLPTNPYEKRKRQLEKMEQQLERQIMKPLSPCFDDQLEYGAQYQIEFEKTCYPRLTTLMERQELEPLLPWHSDDLLQYGENYKMEFEKGFYPGLGIPIERMIDESTENSYPCNNSEQKEKIEQQRKKWTSRSQRWSPNWTEVNDQTTFSSEVKNEQIIIQNPKLRVRTEGEVNAYLEMKLLQINEQQMPGEWRAGGNAPTVPSYPTDIYITGF